MKQLSALGARRHAFFRSPRRMRPLVDRLEPGELLPNGPFSFYGGGCAGRGQDAGRPGFVSLEAGGSVETLLAFCRSREGGREGWRLGRKCGEAVRPDRIPGPE